MRKVIIQQTPMKFRSYMNILKTYILQQTGKIKKKKDKFLDTYNPPKLNQRT
jgi:hypothetical protein